MSTHNLTRRLTMWAAVVAGLLLIPLLGNWPWTLSDFVIAGMLVFGAGLIFELLTKTTGNPKRRAIVGLVVAVVFVTIYVELAVGLFGSPFAGS